MLTDRQKSILDVFLEAPDEPRSVSDFSSLGTERTSLFRDLKKMTDEGILILKGKPPKFAG